MEREQSEPTYAEVREYVVRTISYAERENKFFSVKKDILELQIKKLEREFCYLMKSEEKHNALTVRQKLSLLRDERDDNFNEVAGVQNVRRFFAVVASYKLLMYALACVRYEIAYSSTMPVTPEMIVKSAAFLKSTEAIDMAKKIWELEAPKFSAHIPYYRIVIGARMALWDFIYEETSDEESENVDEES